MVNKDVISKIFMIPQRYMLGIMGFLAVVNAYIMRVILSVAITEMVPKKHILTHGNCYHHNVNSNHSTYGEVQTNSSMNMELYPWTGKQQGLILSSFYWGYVITHIPGAIIAQKFGGKYVLASGILCTALFTILTPFIIYATDGYWLWVVVIRIFEGLGEGTTFPALTTLLANWVPVGERSKIGTLVYAGGQIGTVVGNSISGVVISVTHNWANVFYIFGIMGLIWVILFVLLCYPDPQSHPFITDKEKIYLSEEISNNNSDDQKSVPWKQILLSGPIWALVVAQIGHDWGFFAMVTDLPKYMAEILHFNVKENGLWSSVPYVFMWLVSMSSGWLCDWLIQKKYMSITATRKVFTTIASMGPAVFTVSATYAGCDRTLAVLLFTIAMGFMGTFYCGMKVNALDLSPNYAGTIMAIVNGIGALTGIIVPYLIGALTENHTLSEWKVVFWISFAVFFVTNVVFVMFASGDVQTWNDGKKNELEMTMGNKNVKCDDGIIKTKL